MSTGLHLLDRIERFASHIRERFHDHHERDFIMRFLDDLIAKAEDLAKPDAALTARAEKAEADLAALQKQVADDEAKAKAALDQLNAASGLTGGPAPVVGTTSTTVLDPTTGNTTSVDHATGTATTTDPSGAAVETDTTAADTATKAAQDAGVTIPAA